MCAATIAAAAAWLSLGTLGIGETRAGALPLDATSLVIAVAAAALVFVAARRAANPLAIVAPLAVCVLPWLPFRVPAAFLLWTGPIVSLMWTGAAAIALLPWLRRVSLTSPAHRQCAYAGMAAFVWFAAAAWGVTAFRPGGDEPHYLVITQSLLYDGDLRIDNNHARGDYHAYYPGDLRPDVLQPGRNGAAYSVHAPGVPILVLPAFAIAGYRGVVVFLLACAAAAAALAWWLAWRVTGSAGAAWFGWAALCGSAPFLLETYAVYPDNVGAVIVLVSFWALLRTEWEPREESWRPWLLHGMAIAILPWLHTRFAVLAAVLGGLVLVRLARTANPMGKAIAFLAVPAASALAWLFFFVILYGTPDPAAPYGGQAQNAFTFLPNGLGGLFFDQGFGLFATAPVLIVAVAGFAHLRRMAVDWIVLALPYLLAVGTFPMWWAGYSAPARFLVPLVPALAVPAAAAWQVARQRGWRLSMVTALIVSVWLSAVMVFGAGGQLGYHGRNGGGATAAPWADWVSPLVDLSSSLPAFVPLPVGGSTEARNVAARAGTITLLPWVAAFGAALLLTAWVARRRRTEQAAALLAIAGAAGVMAASQTVWASRGVDPYRRTDSQLALLRAAAHAPALLLDLGGRRRMTRDAFVAGWQLDVPLPDREGSGAARLGRPLLSVEGVPAGEYELRTVGDGDEGWVMAGIAPDQFALVTEPVGAFARGVRLWFPVDVRSLVVRADEVARDRIDRLVLQPVRLLPANARVSGAMARRAVKYGSTSVFFLDDRAFPEPSAFWVGGARQTAVVLATDGAVSVALSLRNAPVANEVTIETAGRREVLQMTPGETRTFEVPIPPQRRAALVRITSSSGFRPSEVDSKSRDARFLGVYVQPR